MNISFTGKGILVVFMTFIPLLCEATTHALIALAVFDMPIEISFIHLVLYHRAFKFEVLF
jgi:hypothetical protein